MLAILLAHKRKVTLITEDRVISFNRESAMEWKIYRKKALVMMRPWMPDDKHPVTELQKAEGSPKIGDMIVRDKDNEADEWLITERFFKENYELVE